MATLNFSKSDASCYGSITYNLTITPTAYTYTITGATITNTSSSAHTYKLTISYGRPGENATLYTTTISFSSVAAGATATQTASYSQSIARAQGTRKTGIRLSAFQRDANAYTMYVGDADDVYVEAQTTHTVKFSANGGTGAPAAQVTDYSWTLTIPSTTPTRPGYSFAGWGTSASATTAACQPNGTYTCDYTTASATTLYAIWRKEPNPPTISSLSVVRVDASGNSDDEGLYCKVMVTWSVDLTSDTVGSSNRGTLSGVYVASSNTSLATALSWSGTYQSATGGTATATFSVTLDEQYAVLVTVTDARNASSRADVLTRAEFVMDFRSGGKAIGIGSAAPQDGLLIGWDTEILGDVTGGKAVRLRNPSVDRDNPGSSDVLDETHCLILCDKDGERTGMVRAYQGADGRIGVSLIAFNETAAGTEVSNYFNVIVRKDGATVYDIGAPAAFRDAIGATSGTFPASVGGTGITSNPSMLVNLGSSSAAGVFAASPRPGVTGTLPQGNGGTGITSNPSMLVNLGSSSAAGVFATSPRPGVTGTLPQGNGGTGITSNPSMLVNLGSSSAAGVFAASPRPGVTGTLPRGNGGTGMSARTTGSVARTGITTGGTLNVYSNGVVCTVIGHDLQLKAALANNGNVEIATLPAGFRPPDNVYGTIHAGSSARNNKGFVRITSGGVVRFSNYSDASWATNYTIAFTITWAL